MVVPDVLVPEAEQVMNEQEIRQWALAYVIEHLNEQLAWDQVFILADRFAAYVLTGEHKEKE
jgi:ribonuclease HIII